MNLNPYENDIPAHRGRAKEHQLGELLENLPEDLIRIMKAYLFAIEMNNRISKVLQRENLRNYILENDRYKSVIDAFLASFP